MAREPSKDEPKRRLRVERNDDGQLERVVIEPSRPPLAPAWAEVDAASRHLDARRPRVPKPAPREREVDVPRAPATASTRSFPAHDAEDTPPLAPAWGGIPAEETAQDAPEPTDPEPAEAPEADAAPPDMVAMLAEPERVTEEEPPARSPRGDVIMARDPRADPAAETPLAPAWRDQAPAATPADDATDPSVPTLELAGTGPIPAVRRIEPSETPLAPAWEGWEQPTRQRPTGPARVPAREPGFVVLSHRILGTASDDDLEVRTELTIPRARGHERPTARTLEAYPHEGAPLAPAWAAQLERSTAVRPAATPERMLHVQILEVEDDADPEGTDTGPRQRVIYLPADLPATVDAITRSYLVRRDTTDPQDAPTEEPALPHVPPAAELPPHRPLHARVDEALARYLAAFLATDDATTDAEAPRIEPIDEAPAVPPEGDVPRKVDEILARHRTGPSTGRARVGPDVSVDVDAVIARYETS